MIAYLPILLLGMTVLLIGGLLIVSFLKKEDEDTTPQHPIYNIVETDNGIPTLRDTAVVLGKRFVERHTNPIQKGNILIIQVLGPSWLLDLRVGNNMRGQCVVSKDLGEKIAIGDVLNVTYIIERPSGALKILKIR